MSKQMYVLRDNLNPSNKLNDIKANLVIKKY